ncbi:hypothetical protein G6F39_012525 [Rhizopus arrhizus]|nr:hypothetical protein G6F39_012525 [Rhizopus arrhizus]
MCLFPHLEDVSPPLDIAQGGFRPQRSALDQALCLHDLIQEYYRRKRHFPVVAFLDIKAAYDTVDRRVIWQSLLAVSAPFALVSVLAHLFDDVSISVLMSNQVSTPFTPSTGVLQGSVLSPHLYSIYINTLPALLRSAATSTTTMVSSLSPSGPPGSGFGLSPGLPFGPTLDVSSLSSSPTAINSLLYADDVAILGSASEVKQMLDLAQIHSQVLGYRWSPTKCAILNAPDPTSSRYVRLTLYDEDIPSVDEFVYLGVPFVRTGISPSRLVAHRKPGAQLKMAQLCAIGANRSGFSLLFSSRLYAMFVRPKLEYGLAISKLLKKDYDELERAQSRCLRLIVGGHKTSSTVVLRHICNLPSMRFRADTLVLKFCLRAQTLPDDCLLSLLSSSLPSSLLSTLRSRRIVLDHPPEVTAPSRLKTWLHAYRQQEFDQFLASTSQVLIKACRPVLRVDPILYVPASRTDRSCLIRWRMGWLPGDPRPCACLFGHTTRAHLMVCPQVPSALWCCLPFPPAGSTELHIDYLLSLLPVSPSARCPPFWVSLCTILWHFDQLCNPDGDYTNDPPPGLLWYERSTSRSR